MGTPTVYISTTRLYRGGRFLTHLLQFAPLAHPEEFGVHAVPSPLRTACVLGQFGTSIFSNGQFRLYLNRTDLGRVWMVRIGPSCMEIARLRLHLSWTDLGQVWMVWIGPSRMETSGTPKSTERGLSFRVSREVELPFNCKFIDFPLTPHQCI